MLLLQKRRECRAMDEPRKRAQSCSQKVVSLFPKERVTIEVVIIYFHGQHIWENIQIVLRTDYKTFRFFSLEKLDPKFAILFLNEECKEVRDTVVS